MYVNFHALFVESPWFTIVHVTVELVATCLASNPELLILKFHNRIRRSHRCFGKIRDDLIKVRVDTLVRDTSAKFWMKFEGCSHNGSVESCPPIGEDLVHL